MKQTKHCSNNWNIRQRQRKSIRTRPHQRQPLLPRDNVPSVERRGGLGEACHGEVQDGVAEGARLGEEGAAVGRGVEVETSGYEGDDD